MKKELFSFWLIRIATFPTLFMSYTRIHALGKTLGTLCYYLLPKFRKRTLSNLALASTLNLSEKQIRSIAKESFQNLVITCLEYPKLARERAIEQLASCENPETAEALLKSGKSVIFFCGHQANWEILFLEGTRRMKGVAIGRPVKNQLLYNWVLVMREKHGGKIISPKNAVKEGLRALRKGGCFLGIVGDQGMPDSGYQSLFFGKKAWTSPLPAILSYRTGSPIIVATTKREAGKYVIHYSDPLWPRAEDTLENETKRLMGETLKLLEDKIKERPGEWLWQHNRWKQQTPEKLKKRFRHESIAIILPDVKEAFEAILSHLHTFKEIYPHEFLTFFVPKVFCPVSLLQDVEQIPYENLDDLLIRDYRFKLLFNFSSYPEVRAHFLKLSAFDVLSFADLKKYAKNQSQDNLSHLLKEALLRTCQPNATTPVTP